MRIVWVMEDTFLKRGYIFARYHDGIKPENVISNNVAF